MHRKFQQGCLKALCKMGLFEVKGWLQWSEVCTNCASLHCCSKPGTCSYKCKFLLLCTYVWVLFLTAVGAAI